MLMLVPCPSDGSKGGLLPNTAIAWIEGELIAIVVYNRGVQITHDLWSTHIQSLMYHLQYTAATCAQWVRFVHDRKLWLCGYLMSHNHVKYASDFFPISG